jgi:hypothetical protein
MALLFELFLIRILSRLKPRDLFLNIVYRIAFELRAVIPPPRLCSSEVNIFGFLLSLPRPKRVFEHGYTTTDVPKSKHTFFLSLIKSFHPLKGYELAKKKARSSPRLLF